MCVLDWYDGMHPHEDSCLAVMSGKDLWSVGEPTVAAQEMGPTTASTLGANRCAN